MLVLRFTRSRQNRTIERRLAVWSERGLSAFAKFASQRVFKIEYLFHLVQSVPQWNIAWLRKILQYRKAQN